MSSAIVAFDAVKGVAITNSGRSYALRRRPGANLDAITSWNGWKRINSVASAGDITARVWAEMKQARGPKNPTKKSGN